MPIASKGIAPTSRITVRFRRREECPEALEVDTETLRNRTDHVAKDSSIIHWSSLLLEDVIVISNNRRLESRVSRHERPKASTRFELFRLRLPCIAPIVSFVNRATNFCEARAENPAFCARTSRILDVTLS